MTDKNLDHFQKIAYKNGFETLVIRKADRKQEQTGLIIRDDMNMFYIFKSPYNDSLYNMTNITIYYDDYDVKSVERNSKLGNANAFSIKQRLEQSFAEIKNRKGYGE